jgi:hypothetical protein
MDPTLCKYEQNYEHHVSGLRVEGVDVGGALEAVRSAIRAGLTRLIAGRLHSDPLAAPISSPICSAPPRRHNTLARCLLDRENRLPSRRVRYIDVRLTGRRRSPAEGSRKGRVRIHACALRASRNAKNRRLLRAVATEPVGNDRPEECKTTMCLSS